MPYAYFGYINRPFTDISGFVNKISSEAEKLLVYEQDHRDGSGHIHCHLLILNFPITKKQLYKRNMFKELQLDGTKKEFGFDEYQEGRDTISYMTKGIYDPVFNKGFTQEEITEAKSKGFIKKPMTVQFDSTTETTEVIHLTTTKKKEHKMSLFDIYALTSCWASTNKEELDKLESTKLKHVIAKKVREILREHRQIPNDMNVVKIMSAVYADCREDEAIEKIVRRAYYIKV